MIVPLKATLSENVNIRFRLISKVRPYMVKRKLTEQIPIIINNFNRLTYLRQLIAWFEKAGLKNIHVIDNASTYPPLLDYYHSLRYNVYRLDKNVGHEALWRTHVYQRFRHDYYVYTDSDVLPVEECPYNILDYYLQLFELYPEFTKLGVGLEIGDLPDHNPRKQEVIEWEQKFWETEIAPGLYKARIDTTFALYRPDTMYQQWETTLRTGFPYMARHLPWYENPDNLSDEDRFFNEHATEVSSWRKLTESKYNG